MSLSTSRSRRTNAGSGMSALIDLNDTQNEFYDNIYGGLNDEDGDNSYQSESSESDTIDSDFSIDENVEQVFDENGDDLVENKSKTKFDYRKTRKNKSMNRKSEKVTKNVSNDSVLKVPIEIDIPIISPIKSGHDLRSIGKKIDKCHNYMKNNEISHELNKTKAKTGSEKREFTQQEMLAEAVITEQINMQSLKEYEKLKFENSKKSKPPKHSIKGPFIRYHSVSMPLIEEINDSQNVSIDDKIEKKYSRTFITFSDEDNCESILNNLRSHSVELPKESVCPVTQYRARYLDPVSQIPFATSQAFNDIRNEYVKQMQIYGDMSQPEVAQWMVWKKDNEHEWKQWIKSFHTYEDNKYTDIETDVQTIQSQSLVQKATPSPQSNHSSNYRRRRKSKK